jgi:hypothetical protein
MGTVVSILLVLGVLVAAAVAVVVVVVAIWMWLQLREDASVRRLEAAARAVAAVLDEDRSLTLDEVMAASQLSRVEARDGLDLLERTLRAYPDPTAPTRYFAGYRPVDAPALGVVPEPEPELAPRTGDREGLDGRMLQMRSDILRTTALDQVDDLFIAHYHCPDCARDAQSLVVAPPSLMADAPAGIIDTFKRVYSDPTQFGIALELGCGCGGEAVLERTVICRTNPTRETDFHITVSQSERLPTLSVLLVDGTYEHLGEDGLLRAFGMKRIA